MLTDEILRRMVEAYKVIETITDSPCPKAFGSNMPDIIRFANDSDVWMAHMESLQDIKDMGRSFRQMQADRVRELERTSRSQFTPRQITDAEEAMSWPALIENVTKREILMLYVACKAKKGDWGKWLTRRNRRYPQKYGVIRRKSNRWVNQCLQEIDIKLRNDEILLRNFVTLHVSQISR